MPTWRSVGRIASQKACDLRLRRQRCMCHSWSHRCWAGHALRCYHRGLISGIALFGSNFLDPPVPISEVQKVRNHFHCNVWLPPFVCLHNQCANRQCLRHSLLTMVIVTCSVHPGGMVPLCLLFDYGPRAASAVLSLMEIKCLLQSSPSSQFYR